MLDTEKIKQKILELAISGKLIKQDDNDEPASELLKKIEQEKNTLIKSGRLKNVNNCGLIYKNSDNSYYEKRGNSVICIDNEIPLKTSNNFEWARLNDICVDINAGGDKPEVFSKTKSGVCTIPVYSNGIENDGLFGFTNKSRIDRKALTVSARGTIGYSVIRDQAYFPIVRLISIIPYECVNIQYLKLIFDLLYEKGDGTSTQQLTIPNIKNKLIPICSTSYQSKIVNTVNNYFALIDKINSENAKVHEYSNQLEKLIINNFFFNEYSDKSYYENDYLLRDVLLYEQPGPYIVNDTKYNPNYSTPVLTPGKTFILGYTNETTGIYHPKNKVIIFDDFTTASRIVDFDFKVKSSAMKILRSSDNTLFNIDYLYYLLQTIENPNITHKRYWISEFSKKHVKIHKLQEQIKIVSKVSSCLNEINNIKNI